MKTGFLQTHPFAQSGFIAFPLLFLIIIIEKHFPSEVPEGFQSFIIAFEFAKTPIQIHSLFGTLSPEAIKKINIAINIDYAFMLNYVLFLIFMVRDASKVFAQRWLLMGIPICLLILSADYYENTVLLEITSIYSPDVSDNDLSMILNKLHVATWFKWGGISLVFALFSIEFLKKSARSSIEGLVCITPLVIGIFALTNNPYIVSLFVTSVFFVFFLLIMFSFFYKTVEEQEEEEKEDKI